MQASRLFLSTVLLASFLVPFSGPASSQTASDPGVRKWLDDFKTAFQARDTKAVMALYTPDVLAYDLIPPLQYVGAESYGKDFESYFALYKGPLSLEYRDVHIYSSGDLALVTCLERVTGTTTNGQPSSVWLRATTGLRRVNGHWLDFHDHISVPTDMETGKSRLDLQP